MNSFNQLVKKYISWGFNLIPVREDKRPAISSWVKYQSPFARAGRKTYEAHSAWGLIEAAKVSSNSNYAEHALRNIDWTLNAQNANGWFQDCCLIDPKQPLTHTIGYALKGVLEGYRYSQSTRLLSAATATAEGC